MSIQGFIAKFKALVLKNEFFYGLLLVIVATASFNLGELSVTREVYDPLVPIQSASVSDSQTFTTSKLGAYVASRSGTKYHLPWCSGAKAIKEDNKIWFSTKEEAENAGYQPAGNCKGI